MERKWWHRFWRPGDRAHQGITFILLAELCALLAWTTMPDSLLIPPWEEGGSWTATLVVLMLFCTNGAYWRLRVYSRNTQ